MAIAAGTDATFTARIFDLTVSGTTESRTARVMTDGTVAITFKRDLSSPEVAFTLSTADGDIVVSDTNLLTVSVPAADTARDENTSLDEVVSFWGDITQTTGAGDKVACGRIRLDTLLFAVA